MQLLDSVIVGNKCNVFDYSNKIVVSILEWERRKIKFKEVRQSTKSLRWVTDHGPAKSADNSIWEEDALDKVKGIGKASIKKYKEFDIVLVTHLVGLSNEQEDRLISGGISAKSLDIAINRAQSAASSEYPCPHTGRRHSENPYESLFPKNYEKRLKTIQLSNHLSPSPIVATLL